MPHPQTGIEQNYRKRGSSDRSTSWLKLDSFTDVGQPSPSQINFTAATIFFAEWLSRVVRLTQNIHFETGAHYESSRKSQAGKQEVAWGHDDIQLKGSGLPMTSYVCSFGFPPTPYLCVCLHFVLNTHFQIIVCPFLVFINLCSTKWLRTFSIVISWNTNLPIQVQGILLYINNLKKVVVFLRYKCA